MNVLITGKNSYIGNHIQSHVTAFGHTTAEVDTINGAWESVDFSQYDAVVHVAAIVHENAKTASAELFEKVNTVLPVEIATRAKESGVKQFVFISTMGVYGVDKSLRYDDSIITDTTPLQPTSLYGKSKLEAERRLNNLIDDTFQVAIVRPPNVYGRGCTGNYISAFKKLSTVLPICPEVYTTIRQSMLYIDNLSELIRLIMEHNSGGLFFPQDDRIPNTVELIQTIRSLFGKKTATSKFLGMFVKLFGKLSLVKKIYGGVAYEMSLSDAFEYRYQIVPFEKGLALTYRDNT